MRKKKPWQYQTMAKERSTRVESTEVLRHVSSSFLSETTSVQPSYHGYVKRRTTVLRRWKRQWISIVEGESKLTVQILENATSENQA